MVESANRPTQMGHLNSVESRDGAVVQVEICILPLSTPTTTIEIRGVAMKVLRVGAIVTESSIDENPVNVS